MVNEKCMLEVVLVYSRVSSLSWLSIHTQEVSDYTVRDSGDRGP